MKKIFALVLALMLFALPVLAEDVEGEGGMETIAPILNLPANPTTGYTWHVNVDDPQVIEVSDIGFYPADTQLLGAGGTQSFRFDAVEAGFAVVTLTYARTGDTEAQHTLVYQLMVDENLNVTIFEMNFQI